MSQPTVPTPCYVLLEEKEPIGPRLSSRDADHPQTAIYGFSDKKFYDEFSVNSPLALRPYPLVKGYLRTQIAEAGDAARLVVVDAAGPEVEQLVAVTVESVLQAQEKRSSHVPVACGLTLEMGEQAYTVQDESASYPRIHEGVNHGSRQSSSRQDFAAER